jgi:hypothetical protein
MIAGIVGTMESDSDVNRAKSSDKALWGALGSCASFDEEYQVRFVGITSLQ